MKTYNVLWIEDEPDKQEAFIDEAQLDGITLHQFDTSIEGMDHLEYNLDFYDSIILDAKGYEESKHEAPNMSGLLSSIKKINSLDSSIPYFIYSGYLDEDGNKSVRDLLSKEEIYTKGKDNKVLIARIKGEADKRPDTKLKHEFSSVFNALDSFPIEDSKTVLEIIKAIKNGGQQLSDNLYFTPLRMILESMFRKANALGLLHDACISGSGNKVNLTESSLFLSGMDTKHSKVKCAKTHFPKLVSNAVKNILYITGAASHTSEVDITENIDVQDYRAYVSTPYLLYHVLFMLADVIIWFDKYSKENNDVALNKSYWEDIEFYVDGSSRRKYKWEYGMVTKIADNGWGTITLNNSECNYVSVYKDAVSQLQLVEGEKVRVIFDIKNPQSKAIEKL